MTRERCAWVLALLVVVGAAGSADAQQAKQVSREYLAAIVDDDPNPLPRGLTEAERALPLPTAEPWTEFTPPTERCGRRPSTRTMRGC